MSLNGLHKLRPIKMNKSDDYHEVLFLIPKKGNRFLLQNVQIEIETKHEQISNFPIVSYEQKQIPIGRSWLEITLQIYIDTMDKVKALAEQTQQEEIFLLFKNVHPNLIKGRITDVYLELDYAVINFIGNSTDKTYIDYITEVENQLNAQQIVWKGVEPEYELDPKIEKKKNIQVPKRKLTF